MAKCYNGAWDSATQRRFAEEDRLMREIRKVEPDAHVTQFRSVPGEGYQVWAWHREVGPLRDTRRGALQAALDKILDNS